ncbi:hypothetical protein QVD17_18449 [Tagetes erecta]|uniref:Uncharacterized protein n=1 Tax=Tagetes erecta TaxID=13708 RepID=A0AAD8NWE1_TARER|nr:hypothetical protein QVD17_18449 [Tagetes erecta]
MDRGFSRPTSTDDEDKDNAFYAELTRQILLLMDENDEVQANNKCVRTFNRTPVGNGAPSLIPVPSGDYFGWWEGGEVPVPGWMGRLWTANGGGTGRELEWNWCGLLALSFEMNEFRINEGGRDRERHFLITRKALRESM